MLARSWLTYVQLEITFPPHQASGLKALESCQHATQRRRQYFWGGRTKKGEEESRTNMDYLRAHMGMITTMTLCKSKQSWLEALRVDVSFCFSSAPSTDDERSTNSIVTRTQEAIRLHVKFLLSWHEKPENPPTYFWCRALGVQSPSTRSLSRHFLERMH